MITSKYKNGRHIVVILSVLIGFTLLTSSIYKLLNPVVFTPEKKSKGTIEPKKSEVEPNAADSLMASYSSILKAVTEPSKKPELGICQDAEETKLFEAGSGGIVFNHIENCICSGPITGFAYAKHGRYLFSFRVTYGSNRTKHDVDVGKMGLFHLGTLKRVTLGSKESIHSAYGSFGHIRYANVINSIVLETNWRNISMGFRSPRLIFFRHKRLLYISGRSGSSLDAIKFHLSRD